MRSTGPLLSSRCAPTISPAMRVVPTMAATRMVARRPAMAAGRILSSQEEAASPGNADRHGNGRRVEGRPEVQADEGLVRAIGLGSAVLFVLGSIIGSGIFLTTGVMAAALPSPTLLMLAWAAGGVITLTGALTYGELASMFPKSGGVYVYLREAFGPAVAFLYGWAALLIFFSGGISAGGAGFVRYVS